MAEGIDQLQEAFGGFFQLAFCDQCVGLRELLVEWGVQRVFELLPTALELAAHRIGIGRRIRELLPCLQGLFETVGREGEAFFT